MPGRTTGAAPAVVDYFDRARLDGDADPLGTRMSDDVGDALAHGPTEKATEVGRDVVDDTRQIGFDSRSSKHLTRRREFSGKPYFTVARDGIPGVSKGFAGEFFNLRHLGLGSLWIDVDEPAGQRSFDGNRGQ